MRLHRSQTQETSPGDPQDPLSGITLGPGGTATAFYSTIPISRRLRCSIKDPLRQRMVKYKLCLRAQ